MRTATLTTLLAAALLGLGAKGMDPQDAEQQMERYATGQRLGECLARGCSVLAGTIQALGVPEKAPGARDPRQAMVVRSVDLKVQERLFGPATPAGSVRLQHAARPAMTKTADGPWLAWEGVKLEVGGPLLVARWAADAPRPSWLGQPEDVALALSEPGLIGAARAAIEQHRRVERDGVGDGTALAQLLRERHDALFAGYLVTLLIEREGPRDADRAALALAGLMQHEAVPAPARPIIVEWLAGSFQQLGGPARKRATDALVGAAAADDAGTAEPALTALLALSELKLLDMRSALSPVRRKKLIEQYRAFTARDGARSVHAAFEEQLGLR